jgi:methyl-accepting chemotaxis protein
VCQSGDIAAAYKLRNQNKLISAEMHAGATGLVEEQKAASVAARTDSRRISDSIAAVAALLILVLGGACATVVRSTSRQLRRSIADLEAGASQVTEAAVRIASSSRDVAQGASEQANALDQTTVSSREMAQATRENAAHSQQAAAFVNGLSRQVTDAVAILGGMITSMDEITASSGRISQIMRVVNEISFQTKLLALNAAVEAARAGESGAGFAVVAEEVRNLAQRTAQASNDTAELIENSILQSREGGAKLSQVAASVHAITESARKVKGLVDHVDASSTEQAEGIERISRAVACMEGVTHRTVSNARDSSQATDELQMQAECLMEVVARLRQMVGSGAEFGSAAKRIPDLAFTGR